jgi:lysophospholipase L1-like esterase
MTSLVGGYIRPLKQRTAFAGNPTIRNRIAEDGIYSPVMTSPPTITAGGTTTGLSGTIALRSPLELRSSNSAIFLPSGHGDYEPVKPYGWAGDVSLSPRSRGDRIVCYEFDYTGQLWEFVVANNGIRYWLWVNEQPVALAPTITSSTGDTQHFKVNHGAAAPAGSPYRIMLMIDVGTAGLVGIKHASTDFLYSPALQASGQLIWIGDSIPEGYYADTILTTENVAYPHGSFVFQLGWRLGLWDVSQGICMGGRGVCATAGDGTLPYLGNVQNDLPLMVRKPSGEGTCIVFQSSSNDLAFTAAQVQAAATVAIQAALTEYPDALILAVGNLVAPHGIEGDMTTYDAAWKTAITNLIDADHFIDTTEVFQGTGNETSPAGAGNCDIYALADQHLTYTSKGPPHPNSKGHKQIADKLAPHIGKRMGISLVADNSWIVT